MTVELAEYLIGLDKYIVLNGEKKNTFMINIQHPMSIRLTLSAPDDLDQNLLINIKESEKKSLKISLHHQDNSTQNGLLRVDFNGRHFNPIEITETVPETFRPFAGQWLDDYAGHIHYVVNGYKPLAWAVPLEVDDFAVKELNGREDYIPILKAFFQKITLKTIVTFNHQMRLI
ncbi:hypothetical protein SAMN06265379_10211 [Saccharicrinis carchari]|uniref:Uncharacterized protein n=1 Tax=Saccharicrinis carchari TaxID=1168039 RepID=A0A521BR82_SACCC|nr:hypothetical protein [Saccharicrinis carchari]SMO49623.1 hypothetical protein SAMN06265379_10211 [Saccharicrinis carchari]